MTTPARSQAGGRRKAPRQAVSRNPLTGLPLAPAMAGSLAIAVAAGGAMSAGMGQVSVSDLSNLGADTEMDSLAAVAMEPVLDDRTLAISRDSVREARKSAASTKLQNAAEAQAKERNAVIASLAKSADKQSAKIKKNLWVLPVDASAYHLTARFGSAGGLWSHNHTGLDFAAPTGTPIHSVANATVTEVGYSGAYGNRTIATLEDGTEIWYCHQSAVSVEVGDVIRGGEVIGAVGSTGNSTGPHLHLEVRPSGDNPVDPYTALVYHGLQP